MNKNHLEALANGLGAQSMVLFLMACRREIPATVSITSDTGWEQDRTWSNGRKAGNEIYFDEVVTPLAKQHGIRADFVRSRYKTGNRMEPLIEHLMECARTGKKPNIPMFGSRGGRLRQVCTDKWKIRAIRQRARQWYCASTMCCAQGIHLGEADRRVKGIYLRQDGKWSIYQTSITVRVKNPDGTKTSVEKPVKWLTHYYPLVDLGMNRRACQEYIVKEKIPYLLSSECDGCPHKDLTRWERTSPGVLSELAKVEAAFNGELFFTDQRIPLMEAIEHLKKRRKADPEKFQVEADFGCGNAVCGV